MTLGTLALGTGIGRLLMSWYSRQRQRKLTAVSVLSNGDVKLDLVVLVVRLHLSVREPTLQAMIASVAATHLKSHGIPLPRNMTPENE